MRLSRKWSSLLQSKVHGLALLLTSEHVKSNFIYSDLHCNNLLPKQHERTWNCATQYFKRYFSLSSSELEIFMCGNSADQVKGHLKKKKVCVNRVNLSKVFFSLFFSPKLICKNNHKTFKSEMHAV